MERSLSLREREKMTRNQQVRDAQAARSIKSADQILAKYHAIGPAAVQAALCCAKANVTKIKKAK